MWQAGSYNTYPTALAVNSDNIYIGFPNSGLAVMKYYSNRGSVTKMAYYSNINYAWGMSFNNAGNKLAIASYNGNRIVEYSVNDLIITYSQQSNSSYSSSNG